MLYAEPSINAKVSATDTTINSQITLVLEVSGVSNIGGAPNLQLNDFNVQSAGQTSSYQWINGQTSSLVAFNYILTPTKTGTLQIPSLTLNVGGKAYNTTPITITVRPESAASGSSSGGSADSGSKQVNVPAEGLRPVFMTATVDSDRVYVGQQILLKIQFLQRPDVQFGSQARYTEPETTGFLVEPLPRQEYTTTINGVRYNVTEMPYALFPTSEGEFAIGSAHVEVAIRTAADPFDPNSFFQNFFGRSQVAQLSTRALPVRVRALPASKPANFSGAVGRYKLSAKVDTNQLEVGKPFNLILVVEGVGNIKSLKEPFLPEPRGFRRYETISTSKPDKSAKFVSGSKEFKILLIPQVSGQLTIPSASYVFFNPAKNEYVADATAEIPLQVKPGTLQQEPESQAQSNYQTHPTEGVRVMEKDIRFLKPGSVRPHRPPIYMRGTFLFFNLIAPLFAFLAFLLKKQSTFRLERASEYRSKNAASRAAKELKKAHKIAATSDPVAFYGAVYTAVGGYLADKLTLSLAGLVWEQVEEQLKRRNVDAAVLSDVRSIFDQADMARFATSSFTDEDRQSALTKAQEVLKKLNETL